MFTITVPKALSEATEALEDFDQVDLEGMRKLKSALADMNQGVRSLKHQTLVQGYAFALSLCENERAQSSFFAEDYFSRSFPNKRPEKFLSESKAPDKLLRWVFMYLLGATDKQGSNYRLACEHAIGFRSMFQRAENPQAVYNVVKEKGLAAMVEEARAAGRTGTSKTSKGTAGPSTRARASKNADNKVDVIAGGVEPTEDDVNAKERKTLRMLCKKHGDVLVRPGDVDLIGFISGLKVDDVFSLETKCLATNNGGWFALEATSIRKVEAE